MNSQLLRKVVRRQLVTFRAKHFHENAIDPGKQWIYSEIEQRLIHFRESSVDHYHPTFSQLVKAFLEQHQHLNKSQLKKAFKRYHKEHAVLRVVSIEFNNKLNYL